MSLRAQSWLAWILIILGIVGGLTAWATSSLPMLYVSVAAVLAGTSVLLWVVIAALRQIRATGARMEETMKGLAKAVQDLEDSKGSEGSK